MKMSNGITFKRTKSSKFTFIKYYMYFLSFPNFIGNKNRNSTLTFIHSAHATTDEYAGHVFFANVSIMYIFFIYPRQY